MREMRSLDDQSPSHPFRIAVGIATSGRPRILADTLDDLRRQRRAADMIVVSYANPDDIVDAQRRVPEAVFVQSEKGLTRQRNAILDATREADLLVYLDDDFYLDAAYLQVIESLFSTRPEITVATGLVVADGINGPGLTYDQARSVLETNSTPDTLDAQETAAQCVPVYNAYGCNMSIRLAPVRANNLRFDERLPLYGWYEDVDFSRQMVRFGGVVRCNAAKGVHLGSKSGRTSGLRLGYSQVANPIYLARKGTFRRTHALHSITTRFLKNLILSIAPEPYVDRRGRLRGNLIGFRDLIARNLEPTRAALL